MGFFDEFRKYRGQRVITCPETKDGAAVYVDAMHAAFAGELRLSDCTRWPERKDCAQLCVSQIAESPLGCLVRSIVTAWYAGKSCVSCGRPIGEITWHEAPPAILNRDGTSCEWKDLPPQDLPRVFRTGYPLCWYCNNVAELERIDANLITRRNRPVEPPDPPLNMRNVY